MPRGLDHIVHSVHDLDAAAAFYARLGFTVGARNRHPWGTHNRIVQLHGFFIELLSVAEPEKIVAHGARAFSFGAFHQDYLTDRQGLSMLLLHSVDAAADAKAFAASGIGDFAVFDFAREGQRPDGTTVPLSFSLAFAHDPKSPRAGFATCQHHHPENFWDPAAQQHRNGARAAAGVVLVADNPTDHHIFLEAFTGLRDLRSTSIGLSAETGHGDLDIIEAVSCRDQFGAAPALDGEGMSFAALRIGCGELEAVAALLRQNDVAAELRVGRLVVPPALAFGAMLVFEQAAEG